LAAIRKHAINKEAMAYAYREVGKAVAAFALGDDAQERAAIRSRAHEMEAIIRLAGPFAQLKHDPATDIAQARQAEWVDDELAAKSRVADAVLCKSRPDGPPPEPGPSGAILLEPDEAIEAVSIFERLENEAKALVAERWFAINSLLVCSWSGNRLPARKSRLSYALTQLAKRIESRTGRLLNPNQRGLVSRRRSMILRRQDPPTS
jgi:hypothetical protein